MLCREINDERLVRLRENVQPHDERVRAVGDRALDCRSEILDVSYVESSCSAGVRLSQRAIAISIRSVAGSSRSFVKVSLNMCPILPRPAGLHEVLAAANAKALSGRRSRTARVME
jgi:hypothetical protein